MIFVNGTSTPFGFGLSEGVFVFEGNEACDSARSSAARFDVDVQVGWSCSRNPAISFHLSSAHFPISFIDLRTMNAGNRFSNSTSLFEHDSIHSRGY